MEEKKISRDVKLLSFAFSIIFLGYASVGQYLTVYFKQTTNPEAGFVSLILTYFFFTIFCPIAPFFINKIGTKKCMMAASIIYGEFILSVLTVNPAFVYLSSVLIGFGAALLWVSQNIYLIRKSDEKSYGKNAGYFNTISVLGSAGGLLIIGFLAKNIPLQTLFVPFSIFPFIGFLVLSLLGDIHVKSKRNELQLILKTFKSKTALLLCSFYFMFAFVSGLVFSIIPIEIKNQVGLQYVGFLSAIIFVMPAFVAYIFGKTSDFVGRKAMIMVSYITSITGLLFIYFAAGVISLLIAVTALALSNAIARTMGPALSGDVSTKENLENNSALFATAQNLAVTAAIIISTFNQTKSLFLVSIFIVVASFLILIPILHSDLSQIRAKISQELHQS